MSADRKMQLFAEGWNVHALEFRVPDAIYRDGKFVTWAEMLKPLTVFEAKALGEAEGKRYAEAVR